MRATFIRAHPRELLINCNTKMTLSTTENRDCKSDTRVLDLVFYTKRIFSFYHTDSEHLQSSTHMSKIVKSTCGASLLIYIYTHAS